MAGIQFIYHSPNTPGNPGFSIDLTNLVNQQGVRLGDIQGVVTEAELGSVGTSSLRLDDPTGTAGNASDAIIGLKQLSINEGRAPSGNRRIGEYYITPRNYYRGSQGVSPGLRTGPARVIDMTLADINAFLSFRILRTGLSNGSNTGFNRPIETDYARVLALLAIPFLADTLFNGLVSSASPVTMDAVDYTGQRPADVLNDCAQQSGKNFFVFYDESGTHTPSPGSYALFYDSNDSAVYPAANPAFQVSNVLADLTGSNTNYPLEDAVLVRDPSRVISGAFWQNGSNSVYVEQPTTSYVYGWRDAVVSAPNLKTVAQAKARLTRYLSENSSEDDRITFTLHLPAAQVNDWKEGQYAPVKFSHLPGYASFRNCRALVRTVMETQGTDEFYDVKYEVTPMALPPQGAFNLSAIGACSVPTLPHATTPGRLLLAIVRNVGNTTQFPSSLKFFDDPVILPITAPATDSGTWTVLATATTDYGGMNIGGPCGGYTSGGGTCTDGTIIGIAYRFVRPGEVTQTPVAASGNLSGNATACYLWEIDTAIAPGATAVTKDAHTPGNPVTALLPTLAGNVLAAIGWPMSTGHGPAPVPVASTIVTGNYLQGPLDDNDPTVGSNYTGDLVQVMQLPSGGAASSSIQAYSAWTSLNYAGVAIQLPPGVTLPTIPYPANHT